MRTLIPNPEIKENLAGWSEELKLSQAENDLIWQTRRPVRLAKPSDL